MALFSSPCDAHRVESPVAIERQLYCGWRGTSRSKTCEQSQSPPSSPDAGAVTGGRGDVLLPESGFDAPDANLTPGARPLARGLLNTPAALSGAAAGLNATTTTAAAVTAAGAASSAAAAAAVADAMRVLVGTEAAALLLLGQQALLLNRSTGGGADDATNDAAAGAAATDAGAAAASSLGIRQWPGLVIDFGDTSIGGKAEEQQDSASPPPSSSAAAGFDVTLYVNNSNHVSQLLVPSVQRWAQPMNLAANAYLRALKGPNASVALAGLKGFPSQGAPLAIDFASLLGPLFYMWLLMVREPRRCMWDGGVTYA